MILITGACGMVGSHLVDYCFDQGLETVGTYYKPTTDITEIRDKTQLIECDVRYYAGVLEVINHYRPTKIYHLAAQSYPTVSWQRPWETVDTNAKGTISVFEAIRYIKNHYDNDYDPVVIVACSSAEYGDSLNNLTKPADEDTPLLPLHPYGVSKVAQDLLAYQYYRNFGIRSIRARIFNTTGPRKVNDVCSDFTKRAVLIEKGKSSSPTFMVGNLETYRAITDVRDLISALVLLSDKGRWGEAYNISGTRVYQMSHIVDIIRSIVSVPLEVETDPALIRPTDEKVIYGDSSKLIVDTGWEQKYPLEQTITDMIDYWRKVL